MKRILIQILIHLFWFSAYMVLGAYFGRKYAEGYAAKLSIEFWQGIDLTTDSIREYKTRGVIILPWRLNELEGGATYEVTPDSSARKYWLIVQPDTTEISNL